MSGGSTVTSFRRHVRTQIVAELQASGQATRAQLMSRLGLSRTALTRILGGLFDDGLIVEEPTLPEVGRTAGRPSRVLSARRPPRLTLAVEVDSNSITTAVVDEMGRVSEMSRHTVPLEDGLDAVLPIVRRAAEAASSLPRTPSRMVVVLPTIILADGSAVHPDGARDLMPSWTGSRAIRRLGQASGQPVVLKNDARMSTLAEARIGAGRGARDLLYLAPGANGIGGGLVVDGRLHTGGGLAGEISHMVVRPGGQLCPCGRRGCLAAEVRHRIRTLRARSGADAVDRDDIGVPVDTHGFDKAIDDVAELIARAVGGIANVVHPQMVVVDDRLTADCGSVTVTALARSIPAYSHPAIVETVQVRAALLGDHAALAGAGLVD